MSQRHASPFEGIGDAALQHLSFTDGRDDWLIRCRYCSCDFFVAKHRPDHLGRLKPFWHLFERHLNRLV